jgi:hypothetical protein
MVSWVVAYVIQSRGLMHEYIVEEHFSNFYQSSY